MRNFDHLLAGFGVPNGDGVRRPSNCYHGSIYAYANGERVLGLDYQCLFASGDVPDSNSGISRAAYEQRALSVHCQAFDHAGMPSKGLDELTSLHVELLQGPVPGCREDELAVWAELYLSYTLCVSN